MKNCGDGVMLARKPLSVWLSVSLFIVGAAVLPLAYRLLRRPAPPPHTLRELTELLSQKAPSLYVVAEVEKNPEGGIYICTQPQPREQLSELIRNPEAIGTSPRGRWQEIVFCQRIGTMGQVDIQSWGEYGMRIGRLVFFGDPDLLQRIYTAILSPTRG